MVKWNIRFTKAADKDARKLKDAGLKQKADKILLLLEKDPYFEPPPHEKLLAELKGKFSRRINKQHRIVYEIFKEKNEIIVSKMFLHYGD